MVPTDRIDLGMQAIRKHGSLSLVSQTNLCGWDDVAQVENTDTDCVAASSGELMSYVRCLMDESGKSPLLPWLPVGIVTT